MSNLRQPHFHSRGWCAVGCSEGLVLRHEQLHVLRPLES